jgi:thioredoxin-like negative regulator of GroEL
MSEPEILAIIVLAALTFLTALLSLGLVGAYSRLRQQVDRLTAAVNESAGDFGSVSPFSLVDLRGTAIDNNTIAADVTAFLFVSPTCRSCRAALANLSALYHKARGGVVVVCEASEAECQAVSAEFKIETVVADGSGTVMRQFGVATVPTALLIAEGRKIRSKGYPTIGEAEEALVAAP